MLLLECAKLLSRLIGLPPHLVHAPLQETDLLRGRGRADAAKDLIPVLAKELEHRGDEPRIRVLARERHESCPAIDALRAQRPQSLPRMLQIALPISLDKVELVDDGIGD